MTKLEKQVIGIATAAREASYAVAKAGPQQKNRALKAIATGLRRAKAAIIAANKNSTLR